MKPAVLYVIMNEGKIIEKSGSSQRGPAVYVLKRNAVKEMEFQQRPTGYGNPLSHGAEVVEFVPRSEA